jgi:hypothetical protein
LYLRGSPIGAWPSMDLEAANVNPRPRACYGSALPVSQGPDWGQIPLSGVPHLLAEWHELAVVLRSRGAAQSDVVVIRIRGLVAAERSLLLEPVEQLAGAWGSSSRTSAMATRMAGVDCPARSRHPSRQSVAIRAQEAGMMWPR